MEVYLDNSATTMCYPEVGELVYHITVSYTHLTLPTTPYV